LTARRFSRAHVGSPMRGPATALLEITYWIDRPLSFLRRKKFQHARHQPGRPGPRRGDPAYPAWRAALRARQERDAARSKAIRWLMREWALLSNAALARLRGDTVVFEIGRAFMMGERVWVCTDVGTRTVCAVLLEELVASGDAGPPYSICETVIDRYGMDAVALS